jgi:hypothetical protein
MSSVTGILYWTKIRPNPGCTTFRSYSRRHRHKPCQSSNRHLICTVDHRSNNYRQAQTLSKQQRQRRRGRNTFSVRGDDMESSGGISEDGGTVYDDQFLYPPYTCEHDCNQLGRIVIAVAWCHTNFGRTCSSTTAYSYCIRYSTLTQSTQFFGFSLASVIL